MSHTQNVQTEEKMAESESKTLMAALETLMDKQKESPRNTLEDEDGFVLLAKESIWPQLYGTFYMDIIQDEENLTEKTNSKSHQEDDDMLFYVQNKPGEQGQEVKVFRKTSKSLPGLGDPHINWEESVYLNMIMHDLDYKLTCAICARLPNQDLKVLSKKTLNVHASHHMRRLVVSIKNYFYLKCYFDAKDAIMLHAILYDVSTINNIYIYICFRMDSKGESSDLSYPNIFFIIDSYDEVFESLSVQENEIVCVELTARYKGNKGHAVVFLGSVKHEALLTVYDAKTSLGTKISQKMSLSWMTGVNEHFEYIRMRGPHGKGYAEMRVGLCRDDLVEHNTINRHRSLSENKASSCNCQIEENAQIYVPTTTHPDRCPKCDRNSPNEGAAKLWSNTVKWFQQKKKSSIPTLSPHLTYVTLPWSRIMKDVIQVKQKPVFLKESRH
ncbi:uncharacterized protein KIAA0930 homolog isoform X1 [Hydractinia symbiolongicarpus]|uniref:uncharacterized protein KIAA0930 homolog isoform X1 n=1 Tax=Hydractinia symbiolongicarpus TaxID=13093 RepID=UPI00254D68D2|nr:uncharacterized protein KIAA0930 homolog isoform X1 [Hydractinia symbiolongicarpus]